MKKYHDLERIDNKRPFAISFDVHQGAKVFCHVLTADCKVKYLVDEFKKSQGGEWSVEPMFGWSWIMAATRAIANQVQLNASSCCLSMFKQICSPDAPCMEYVPTSTTIMLPVNIPRMEHLGTKPPELHGK